MTPEFVVGSSFGGYEIIAKIGAGGMGAVYRARHIQLNRVVAIKVVSPELVDPEWLERFQREVQMASALNHPHIVTVFEAGSLDGRPYLVTEFMAGGTLRDWARARQAWPQVVGILIGVGDGVAAAHAAGILHRDLKPENILLTKELFAKVADFGSAKRLDNLPENADAKTAMRTRAGFIIGTTGYMSPEQALGQDMGPGSDIFSFGVVLYELLAGRHPFAGRTSREVLEAIIHGTPSPLDDGLPLAVRMIVEKALEKEPGERYQNMRELVADLRRVARRRGRALAADGPERLLQRPPARPWWRELLADVASIAVVVSALAGVRAYLDDRAVGDHVKSLEYALLQEAFLSGADPSTRWAKDDPRLPAVIDISHIRPDKSAPTDRTKLSELVDTLRSMNVAAIGLDIDLSPEDSGSFVTPHDPQLFAKWTQYSNVRVGVFRREGDLPRRWLGRSEFQELAAGLLLPAREPALAAQYSASDNVTKVDPSDVLLAMPAALYEIVHPGSRARLLENPRLTRATVGNRNVLGHFPVDFSFMDRLLLIKYRERRDLDGYTKELSRRVVLVGDIEDTDDLRCVPTRTAAVPGVLLHASAFATLNRGILQQPDGRRTAAYNALIALAALVVANGVRIMHRKRVWFQALDLQGIETVAFVLAGLTVALTGVAAMGLGHVYWPDGLWLAFGLFLVPHVKSICRIGLRWARGIASGATPARSVFHGN